MPQPDRTPSAARDQLTEREARLIAGTYTGSDVEALREALLDAERRALAYQEFIAYTDDNYGDRMGSQWKAHARAVLLDE